MRILIKNGTLVSDGKRKKANILLEGKLISKILEPREIPNADEEIDAEGKFILPGVIDTHVHFREPGLTTKADIASESRAAVAGGVTSFCDMPNTLPQCVSREILEEKFSLAAEKSLANFSFLIGVTEDNFDEIQKLDRARVCALKAFFGSSTGGMLLGNEGAIERLFAQAELPIVAHCESEEIINANRDFYKKKYGEEPLPIFLHSVIRNNEACLKSTENAISLAQKYRTRLHLAHISTRQEAALLSAGKATDKLITAETCPHYLWFSDDDYERLGAKIKCNPAVKSVADREALLFALQENRLDTVATDHAPHLLSDKIGDALKAASGMPSVQFSLNVMLEFVRKNKLSLEQVVEKMCHAPAEIFSIYKRGFVREGYFADLVIVDLNAETTVSPTTILSKCGWSPFEDEKFSSKILHTFVNGKLAFSLGNFDENSRGEALFFKR